MDQVFIWAQIFGVLAMASGIFAWQLKHSKQIMITVTVTDLCWAVQYYLLGASTGGLVCLVAATRNLCAAYLGKNIMKYIVVFYLVAVFIVTCSTFKVWFDALPFMATVVFSFCLAFKNERFYIARANIIGNACWTLYGLLTYSYIGVIYGVFMFASVLIGMAKHEKWELGKCFKTFPPSFIRALFTFPSFRTYP